MSREELGTLPDLAAASPLATAAPSRASRPATATPSHTPHPATATPSHATYPSPETGRAAPETSRAAPETSRAAPETARAPDGSGAPPDPQRVGQRPATRRPFLRSLLRRRAAAPRRQGALLAVGLLLAATAGWIGDAAWRSAQDRAGLLRTAGLSVVVTDARPTSDSPTRLTADLAVRLTNLGLVPVRLSGSETTYDAATVVGIDPPQVRVPVGATRSAVLQVAVGCRSPQPLNLPPLQVTTPDGALLSVPADGAGQALVDLCTGTAPVGRVVRLVSATPEQGRLTLRVTASSGRTTRILAVRAGGVPLAVRPLPTPVDGQTRTLWLDRPADCPVSWQRTGFPQTLDVDVDVGSDATVTLLIGYPLAAWLLDGPCGAVR